MNCQSCKNPISDGSLECDWCGAFVNSVNEVYDVILVNNGKSNLLALVKEIHDITGLGIYDSKKIVDNQYSLILKTNDLNLANYIKNKLEELSAVIEIKKQLP